MLEGINVIATGQLGQSIQTNYGFESTKRPVKGTAQEITLPGSKAEFAKPSEEEVINAIEMANKKFEFYNTRVEFSIHEKTHEIMIKVYKDDEVIREIPPEKILDMVAKMMEMAGLLVDEKA